MTLYYNLVFGVLLVEMGIFMTLAFPVPRAIRRSYLRFLSQNALVQKGIHYSKIGFGFIGLLFLDSVNRVYRVSMEFHSLSQNKAAAAIVTTERSEIQARRFYSQRNMYLCGFTLFLSFVLHQALKEAICLMNLELEIERLKGTGAEPSPKVKELTSELEKAHEEIDKMKVQLKNMSSSYDEAMNDMQRSKDKSKN